jgi:hypothetical protein
VRYTGPPLWVRARVREGFEDALDRGIHVPFVHEDVLGGHPEEISHAHGVGTAALERPLAIVAVWREGDALPRPRELLKRNTAAANRRGPAA